MGAVVSMSAELDMATVLERLVAAGCRLTGARYGALGVLGPHGGLQEFVHQGVDVQTAQLIGHLPEGRGVLGHLVERPAPPAPARPGRHTRRRSASPPHHPPMRSFLGVPVRARGAVFGNLYLTDKAGPAGPGDFTVRDEQVAVALAAAAGVAVGHARAYHQVREHERWLETAAAATATLTGGRTSRRGRGSRVLARVRTALGGGGRDPARGRRTTLPAALAAELTGRSAGAACARPR